MDILKKRREKANLIIAYQTVFDSEHGRKVLKDLMSLCGFVQSSMDDNSHVTAYNEGKRSVIVDILNKVNTDPDKIVEILKDNRKE